MNRRIITGSSGAEIPAAGFRAVDIHTFRNTTRDITFDVFMKLSDDKVVHVFSKTSGLDYKRLASYIQKGIHYLYVRDEDLPAYQAFILRPADLILTDPHTSPERKIATLLNMTEQNMTELFSQINVTEQTATSSRKVIRNYVDLMTQNPQTLATILKLVSHGEYLYYHSIAVAIFSIFIGRALGQFDSKTLEWIGLGGFMHDIGCTQLSNEVVNSPVELTDEQWESMRSHPRLGLHMIENAPSIPDEVRYIVYQHHEEPSGHGYPNQISGPVIYFPARIVGVADAFSALISKRPFRPAYDIPQAIEVMKKEKGKFDANLVDLLASIFVHHSNGKNVA